VARRLPGALIALAVLAAGCGGDGEARPASDNGVVDPDADPPYVGALSVNPRDQSLLMATNAGTFAVRPGDSRLQRISVRVRAGGRSGPARRGMAFSFTGPDRLVGSGHPGNTDAVEPLLGFIRSNDGGKTWRSISQLGQADLHSLAEVGDQVVAADGGEAKVLVSSDGGKNFEFRRTPLVLIDMDVDPTDPRRLVGSTEQGMHTSDDGGRTWTPADTVSGSRFAWPEPDRLFRVDPNGEVQLSEDGGSTWDTVGVVEGEPQALAAAGSNVLYVADIEGTIRESRDGGRNWTVRAGPPGT